LIKELREIVIIEQGKPDDIYVRIIEYIYPQSLKFVENFKDAFSYSRTDLWNIIQQDTTHFLTNVEAIYMRKDNNLIRAFINLNYDCKIKMMDNMKKTFDSKTINLDQFQNELLDLITSTNLSIITKFAVDTINRYNNLIRNKNQQIDMTASFCKDILDSIQKLLQTYCNLVTIIIEKRSSGGHTLTPTKFLFLSKITFLSGEFQQIFLYDLKDFFKFFKFFEEIEDDVKRRVSKIELNIDKLYIQISSFTSNSLNQIYKNIKYKETYNINKLNDYYSCSSEMELISNFLRPIFAAVYLLFIL
jgi:regulator of sigma D